MEMKGKATMVSKKAHRVTGANALAALLLVIGIIVLLNVLATQFFWRADLTEGNLNSLSPSSIGVVEDMDGLVVRVFISDGLPEKISTQYGGGIQPRALAGRLRDLLNEYAAHAGTRMQIEYVTENILEEAETAKLPRFSSQEAELTGGGLLKFKEYVIGATFLYGSALERFPREVGELQPQTFEFEITKRLLKLRDRVSHADAYQDVLSVGDALQKEVKACAASMKVEAEDGTEGSLPGFLGNQQGGADLIGKLKEALPEIEKACAGVPQGLSKAGELAAKNEFLELMIAAGDNFSRLYAQMVGAMKGEQLEDPQFQMQIIQIQSVLQDMAKAIEDDHEQLKATPGQRKIAFLCGADTLCPFADLEPRIRPELGMILGQKNAINQRVISQLQQIEERINGLNQQIGTGLFRRRGYAITRAQVGEPIPEDASALVIYAPRHPLSEKSWYHVDQFILSGKPVVALVGRWDVSLLNAQIPEGDATGQQVRRDLIKLSELPQNLGDRLASYGVGVQRNLVMEPASHDQVTLSVVQQAGQFQIPVQRKFPYPLLPRVSDLDKESVLVRGLEGITLPYVAPLELIDATLEANGTKATVLMESTPQAVVAADNIPLIPPQTSEYVVAAKPAGTQALGVLLEGPVASAFTKETIPDLAEDAAQTEEQKLSFRDKGEARLLVIGSNLGIEGLTTGRVLGELNMAALSENPVSLITEFPKYQVRMQNWETRIGQLGPVVQENLRFLFNVLDWAAQQEELTEIRGKGITRRPLEVTSDGTKRTVSWGLIAGLPILISFFGLFGAALRRRRQANLKL